MTTARVSLRMARRRTAALRTATAALLVSLASGCVFTPPQDVPAKARPQVLPVRNITGFSESLRCMDDLFLAFGKQNIVITSQGIPDATGEVSAGTKEMLISAISRMSERSNAFTFVDFDQTQLDINQLQGLVGFSQNFVVPNYYIRGAISQLDENVVSETVGASVSLSQGEIGAQVDQVVSVVSVDMNVGDLLTRQILPGMSANNSIAVRRRGIGGDAGGQISKAGVSINVSLNRSEGLHQAVRTLVDLSAVETLGRLTQVPYWRCLQIEQTNPEMLNQARSWFNGMSQVERVRFVQRALKGQGLYDGPISDELDPATKEAIGAYQAQRGLIADGRINFDLYAALLSGDLARGRMPDPERPSPPYKPDTALALRPLQASLTTALGSAPRFYVGQKITALLRPSSDAFAYCFYRDNGGRVSRIFPNRFQPNALVAANTTTQIPGPDARFEIRFETPDVTEEIRCLVSDRELGTELPDALKAADLAPLPVASLDQVTQAFRALGKGRLVETRLPITVTR